MAAADDMETDDVCEELDQLILHLFDALEMLQTKREAFNSLVEQGWFLLSKSRYAMGNKSVSALQFRHQMTPLTQVNISKNENGQRAFQVISEDADASRKKPGNAGVVEEIGPAEQGLRRRKGPGKAEVLAQNTTSKEGPGKQDPLTWFGILVPQSLRQAQKTFQEGIRLVAEISSLQNDIETTQRRYRALLEKKRRLLAREEQCCS